MDGTQEIISTQDAEKTALKKVTDIYNTPLYKHAFNRNPVDYDLDETGLLPKKHTINTSVDRLKGIITSGLVSDTAADSMGQSISKNYSDPNNNEHVSLHHPDNVKVDEAFGSALPPFDALKRAVIERQPLQMPTAKEVFVVLVNAGVTPSDFMNGKRGISVNEVLKEDQIHPEDFEGIVIIDKPLNNSSTGTQFYDDELHPEELATEIAELQRNAYGADTAKYFPVYGNSGDLYWPKKMSYEEIQETRRELETDNYEK